MKRTFTAGLITMDKLEKKNSRRKVVVKKSVPRTPKRKLPDVRKFAGSIPGMDKWALEEVRQMRDEW